MKTIINTKNAPAPIGPYNQAVLIGNMLFTSGQIAIHPANGELVNETIEAETTQVMNNLLAVLKEATAPARETVQVAKLPKDVHIEISLIAVKS